MTSGVPAGALGGVASVRSLGRYEILHKIASGGMATVYLGRARGLAGFERLVAVKCCHPHLRNEQDFATMFLNEARLAARIHHPNVVATVDVGAEELLYLVMVYVEGGRLSDLIAAARQRNERLPVDVTLRITLDALAGLHAAHELRDDDDQPLNLIHHDVTPHNILVGVDGVARITDFGIARAQARTGARRGRDEPVVGKIAYMAPEQFTPSKVTRRADLFSAAIVLWEALTGRTLFRGTTDSESLNLLMRRVVPPPSTIAPEVPKELDAVVLRALQRDPARRYATAAEFADALDAAGVSAARPRRVSASVKDLLADALAARRELVWKLSESKPNHQALSERDSPPADGPAPPGGAPGHTRSSHPEIEVTMASENDKSIQPESATSAGDADGAADASERAPASADQNVEAAPGGGASNDKPAAAGDAEGAAPADAGSEADKPATEAAAGGQVVVAADGLEPVASRSSDGPPPLPQGTEPSAAVMSVEEGPVGDLLSPTDVVSVYPESSAEAIAMMPPLPKPSPMPTSLLADDAAGGKAEGETGAGAVPPPRQETIAIDNGIAAEAPSSPQASAPAAKPEGAAEAASTGGTGDDPAPAANAEASGKDATQSTPTPTSDATPGVAASPSDASVAASVDGAPADTSPADAASADAASADAASADAASAKPTAVDVPSRYNTARVSVPPPPPPVQAADTAAAKPADKPAAPATAKDADKPAAPAAGRSAAKSAAKPAAASNSASKAAAATSSGGAARKPEPGPAKVPASNAARADTKSRPAADEPPPVSTRPKHSIWPADGSPGPRYGVFVMTLAFVAVAGVFMVTRAVGPSAPAEPAAATSEASTDPVSATSEPAHGEPAVAEPSHAEPVAAEPTVAEPTQPEPTAAEPAVAEPTQPEPTAAEPAQPEPTRPAVAAARPAQTEPPQPEPTAAEPTRVEATRPTQPEPAQPAVAAAQPEPAAAQPEPAPPPRAHGRATAAVQAAVAPVQVNLGAAQVSTSASAVLGARQPEPRPHAEPSHPSSAAPRPRVRRRPETQPQPPSGPTEYRPQAI